MALTSAGNGFGLVADAGELRDAVDAKLLTPEEARKVYWAQFPSLVQAAASTPPPIGEE